MPENDQQQPLGEPTLDGPPDKRFEDLLTLQFYIHDEGTPQYLPEPETDEERAALRRLVELEGKAGRTITVLDRDQFYRLVPEWEATCDAMNEAAERLAHENAGRQHLKEQALSGEPDLIDLGAAYDEALRRSHAPEPGEQDQGAPEPSLHPDIDPEL